MRGTAVLLCLAKKCKLLSQNLALGQKLLLYVKLILYIVNMFVLRI